MSEKRRLWKPRSLGCTLKEFRQRRDAGGLVRPCGTGGQGAVPGSDSEAEGKLGLGIRRVEKRPLDKDRWVYLWADGISSRIRTCSDCLCALVIVGVNDRGEKHFLAIEDGMRESITSFQDVLLDLKERGLSSPKLGIGDGAMGFWGTLQDVFPQTKPQRCWVHKAVNVLNDLPDSLQEKAKKGLHEIWMSEGCEQVQKAFDRFLSSYEAQYPKATECLLKDREPLLAFYDFPAEHRIHIRMSHPIELTFATIHPPDRSDPGMLHLRDDSDHDVQTGALYRKTVEKEQGI